MYPYMNAGLVNAFSHSVGYLNTAANYRSQDFYFHVGFPKC